MKDQEVDTTPTITVDTFDMDNPTPVLHRWVDRGLKLTCEGASHPYHEAWKFKPKAEGKMEQ